MADIELEEFHLERLIQAMDINASVIKRESPDFILKMEQAEIGVELTRFFLPPDKGAKSQQELGGLGNLAVEKARRIFRKNGGKALYVNVVFAEYPQDKKQAYDLAKRLAFVVLERQVGIYSRSQDIMLGEIANISIHPSVDGENELWQGGTGGWVAPVEFNHIQSLIDKKESKIHLYSQVCNELWLVIAQDIFGNGAPSELMEQTSEKVYQSSFNKVIWLETHIPRASILNTQKPNNLSQQNPESDTSV